MRPDMSKVLVERERLGVEGAAHPRRRNRRIAKRDLENAPTKVSMSRKRQYGYECKQLNENLNPLKRFIEANVGRRWDDVYSEIRAHVTFANTVQQHILQHLWQYVERNAVIRDNGVACALMYRRELRPLGHDDFFVHPTTGVLSRGQKTKKKAVERKPKGYRAVSPVYTDRLNRFLPPSKQRPGIEECRILGDEVYIKQGGLWFEAVMRPVPEGAGWGIAVQRTRKECRFPIVGGPSVLMDVAYADEGPIDIFHGRIGAQTPVSRFSINGDRGAAIRSVAVAFYGRLDRYCARKGHQLDTKALRRLGLTGC